MTNRDHPRAWESEARLFCQELIDHRPSTGPVRLRRDVWCSHAEEARLGVASAEGLQLRPLSPEPWARLLVRKRPSEEEITEILEATAGALQAGAGVDAALELAAETVSSPASRGVVGSLRRHVRSGLSFSQSLEQLPRLFGGMVVALSKAAETAGGELGRVLGELAERRRREAALKRRFIQALAYPSVVLGMTVVAALVLQLRALPPMVENFKQLGARLPAPTLLLHQVSGFMLENGPWILLGGAMVVIGCIRPVKRLGEAERVQRLILEAPVIGPILSGICLVRALNALALLKACGAPTDLQFTLAAQAAGTAVHRRYFSSLHRRVVAGEELQDAAQREGHLLPGEGGRLVAARLRIGSFSGDSATLLRRLADELLERADHRASLLPQILEIPLLLVCGAVIAGLVLAMLLPMPGLVIDLMRRPGGF